MCLRLPSSVRPVILPRGHAWRVSLPLSWSLAESVEVRKPEEVAADTLRSPSRRIFRQRPPIFMCPGVAIHSGSGVSANSDEAEVSPQQPRRHPPSDCSRSGPSDVTGSLWDQPLWCDGGVIESAVMPTICLVSPLIGWLSTCTHDRSGGCTVSIAIRYPFEAPLTAHTSPQDRDAGLKPLSLLIPPLRIGTPA